MFKKDQRVIYMSKTTWHIATVLYDTAEDADVVVIQPHGENMASDTTWVPFKAPVERVTAVHDGCRTVEQAVLWLALGKNWEA